MLFRSKDPTTYVVALSAVDPSTLDPALDYGAYGGMLFIATHNTLLFFDQSNPNNLIPELALATPSVANGGIAADGKRYTFKIRPGVKFHNGATLTATDVAYTLQRGLLQGGSLSPQWLLAEPLLGVRDVTELVDSTGALVDDPAGLATADAAKLQAACQQVIQAIVADPASGTLTFTLAQPWAPFLMTVALPWFSVRQQKWLMANGGWDGRCDTWQHYYGKRSEELNQTQLGAGENGTGPYRLDHWTPNQEIVLVANADYWRMAPAWPDGPVGAPKLKTIIFKQVEEFSARFALLQAGEVDSIDVAPQDYPQMDTLVGEVCTQLGLCQPGAQPHRSLRVYQRLPGTARIDVAMRWQVNTAGGNEFIGSGKLDGKGIPPAFFSNRHIRRAFAYCFDYQRYIDEVLLGESVQSYNVMLPGEIGYEESSPHYTYDLDQCKAEFAAAAPELQDQYGADINDVGFQLTVANTPGDTQSAAIMAIFARNLAAVNPQFVIAATNVADDDYWLAFEAGKLPIFTTGWLEDLHDPHNWVVTFTTGFYGDKEGLPAALRAQFKAIIDRGVAETDPVQRAAIYHEFNQLFYDQVPTILLAVQLERRYEQRWVKGWFHNPLLPGTYFYSLAKE